MTKGEGKALKAIKKAKETLSKIVVVGKGPHGYWDCEKDCFVPFEKKNGEAD